MNPLLRAAACCLLASLFFVGAIPRSYAQSQQSAEVTRGLQWLVGQVQTDGSLLNEPRSIATKLQNRTETAQTLKLLATLPVSLATGISADVEDNTEYLARKSIVLSLNGWDTTSYINQIVQSQNADGGFGGAASYASNVLDTAWTVLALAQTNMASTETARRGLAYLVSQIAADGGIVARGDASRLHLSAIALLALQTTSDGSNATAVRTLASWVLQQQGADGGWSGNTYMSAFALAAITPVTADAAVRSNARNFLLSKQAADGSWNTDPFLTALVLRALSAQSLAPASTTGILKGRFTDRTTNVPLSGVTVTLSGASSKVATSDDAGNFSASGLIPGIYSATYTRIGYSAVSASYSINAAQISDAGVVGLTQVAATGIIRGRITTASGNALAGVTISVSGAATATATSDANGSYEFSAVAPGAATLAASLSGYQSASGNGTLLAGQTLIFSPTLYASGQTPPTTIRYTGSVVSAGQALSLSGVSIQLSGASTASAMTTSNGQFDVTLIPGSYTAKFSLPGYGTVTQTFVAPAGTTVAAGPVSLSPTKSTSSIRGRVVTTANVGIAGASVQVVGTTRMTIAAADGTYLLDNVADTTLSIRASGTGYDSQTINLQLTQPMDVAQNFVLAAQSTAALSIADLVASPVTAASATDVVVTTAVNNAGAAASTAVVQLQVLDQNQKVIGKGLAYDASGNLIGQLTIGAGQQQSLKLVWNTAQFPPGAYALDVRLVEAGSITRATPQGNLIVERAASITVTGRVQFTGVIVTNPPVLQAGTNTPVKLSAIIQNDGNTDIPAQAFTLVAIDTKDNTVASSWQATGTRVAVSGVQSLIFPDWTSAKGGSFRLELTAADSALGKVIGALYVGDSAKASYTVDRLVVPAGTQSVRGTVKVTGQDVTTGVISDPLAPLIKTAVQKAVPFNYATAVSDTMSSRCLRCHVQSQALVGGELTRSLTNYNSFTSNRDIILNSLTTHQQSNGAIDGFGGYQQTQSMLGIWALNTWHKKDEVLVTLAKGANYLTSIQAGDGSWNADHASGWWSTAVANTGFNVKSLTEIYKTLKEAPAGSAINYSATPWVSQGIAGPYHLTSDAAGNVYVSNYTNGTIQLVKPDGTSQPYMTGLTQPTALVFAPDGTAYASSFGGLYRRNGDGSATQITSRSGSGLAIALDGNLYMSSYWDNKISKITSAGVASDYIAGGALVTPWSIAISPAGDLIVANYGGQNILRYHADLTYDVPIAWVVGNPYAIQKNGSGWLVTTASGLYSYSAEWHGERLIYSTLGGATVTPDGTIVVGDVGSNVLYKVAGMPVTNGAFAAMDGSIAKGVNWLLLDGNTDTNNNLSLAQRLIGLNAAKLYYKGQPIADTLQAKMETVGAQLRARVNSDGGWGWRQGNGSDSLVTAQVGVALDSLNPSASDPIVQNAVKLLLSRQHADGTWYSENGILTTALATTTWVSIWLPTVLDRLGGVDTDLSVTFAPNVAMTNPDVVPSTTTANSDGSTTYSWHMQGVTSAGRMVNYDVKLANLALDEARPVSTDAHLTFKNSFTNGIVDAPIDIPRVKASAFLGLGISTDKISYSADAPVAIVGQVTNAGANPLSGKVRFDIYSADNVLVSSVGTAPFSNVAAGASTTVGLIWNTGKTLSGAGYYALGTLFDDAGRLVGTAQSKFAISALDVTKPGLTSGLTTDKQSYLPADVVKLSDRLINGSGNTLINDVRITTTVTSPDGTIRFTRTELLPQLAQGNLKDYVYNVPLNFAPAGQYGASVTVTTADGAFLTRSTTQFSVGATADSGSGLRGMISATPKQVPQGDAVILDISVSNSGNGALENLPLKVSILDPAAQQVLAEFPYVQTLKSGDSTSRSQSWIGSGVVGTSYVAVLTATVGGKAITLAQDGFTLIAPPIKLDITQVIRTGSRVLALVSCKSAGGEGEGRDDHEHEGRDRGHDSDAQSNHERHEGRDGDHKDRDDDNDDDDAGNHCSPQDVRQQAVIDALSKLGVPFRVTQSIADFKNAMRSGTFNVYWLSNAQHRFGHRLMSELRERVYHGDSLVSDGAALSRNGILADISGIDPQRKVGNALPIHLGGTLYPVAMTLPAEGVALGLKLRGVAKVQGTFTAVRRHEDDDENEHRHDDKEHNKEPDRAAEIPGIVSNQYGMGSTLAFGFDLTETLRLQALPWQAAFQTAITSLTPPLSSTITPGAVVPVKTSVTNQANAVDLAVKSQLAPDEAYLGSNPTGAFDAGANTIAWAFGLGQSKSADLFLTLRAPNQAGIYDLQTFIGTVKNGVTTPYGMPLKLSTVVVGATAAAQEMADSLQALIPKTDSERRAKVAIAEELRETMVLFNRNTVAGYEASIGELLEIVGKLPALTSIDTTGMRHDLDRIMEEAQWRWTLATAAQPPVKPKKHKDRED